MDRWFFNQEFETWINQKSYNGTRPEGERPAVTLSAEEVFTFGLIEVGVAVCFRAFHVNAVIPHYIPIKSITRRSITGTAYVRYILEHDHERTLDHDNSVNPETRLYIVINTPAEYILYSMLKSLERNSTPNEV